jgi:hypothetical protein
MVKRASYREALREARKDLQTLFRRREQLERQIARTRQTVIALSRVCEKDDHKVLLRHAVEKSFGLTDAIRTALMAANVPLDALSVRSALETVGYDIGASPNTLVSIHTVLKRLAANGEIKQVGKKAGRNETGPLFSSLGFWWGQYGIPKGWTLYPTKRLLARWTKHSNAHTEAEREERDLEESALKKEEY